MKKILLLLLLSCSLSMHAANPKPFTIPELKTWYGGKGSFVPTKASRIVYTGNDKRVAMALEVFAADYQKMFNTSLPIVKDKARAGDFAFAVSTKKEAKANTGDEAYKINIGRVARVEAATPQGIHWATRTILQLCRQNEGCTMPQGTIIDAPAYPTRGFMLDCGRKFFTMRVLRQYVQMLSYYKMNTLHIHLNDNGHRQFFNDDFDSTPAAFRLECDTYPGLTARDGHYTKEEFRSLQRYADSLGVEIIPEIDFPAHSLAFTRYKPELASKKYGKDHLDLFNPETYTFLDALLKEYLSGDEPVFSGKYMHIGTDEYANEDKQVVEKFRYLTDRYIKYVEKFGKKAMIWGQQTHAKGTTPIKVKDVTMQIWNNNYANPHSMDSLGYDIISIPDWQVYIVPKAGYYQDYLDIKKLYQNWTPAHIGDVVFPEGHRSIKGGMFAVWNDHIGNGISAQDVHYRFFPALQTLSTKTWSGISTTFSFEQFDSLRKTLDEAPGLNVAGYYPQGTILKRAQVNRGDRMPIDQVGWDYEVAFDIDYASEEKGTILFSSDDATFYLSDPINGLIGFSRDGYLYNFGYQLLLGEKVNMKIRGDRTETSLWVNGQMVSRLNVLKLRNVDYNQMHYFRTLVFPLMKAGSSFKSKVTNLLVTSQPLPTKPQTMAASSKP